MRRIGYLFLALLCMSLVLFGAAGLCDDSSEGKESGAGRYQVYTTQNVMMLLDTKTGKVWRISADMSGKLKAEGVSVEGLAYSASELDTLNNKVKEINLEGVAERDKIDCRNELSSQFSYSMEQDKINKIVKYYKAKKQ